MIPIKVRAFDREGKEMIYNPPVEYSEKFDGGLWVTEAYQEENALRCSGLMPFMGLSDAAEKEVYQGDIISIAGMGNFAVVLKGTVWAFENKKHLGFFHESEESFTVVGNIWQTPELLNKQP